jgi:hypothetical protein
MYFYYGYNYVYACRETVWKCDSKERLGEIGVPREAVGHLQSCYFRTSQQSFTIIPNHVTSI